MTMIGFHHEVFGVNGKKFDVYDIGLCTDCFICLVNGDVSDDVEDPDKLLSELTWAESITPGHWNSSSDEDETGENDHHFSTESCDGCGTSLHGDRYDATAWELLS